jgi:hypothetical protein
MKGKGLHDRPSPISEERWNQMNPAQRAIEVEAEAIFLELRFHEESLIWACLEKGVMSEVDIRNYPTPHLWTIEQCRTWHETEMEEKFSELIETMELAELQLLVAGVIEFGLEEIPEESLRRILRKLVNDQSEKGLVFWQGLVDAAKPALHEWWRVSNELAEDLIDQHQPVLINEFGCWWGYEMTGENAIGVIRCIAQIRRERDENCLT